MTQPVSCLISIIVPSYNQAAYVSRALESIFTQTDARYEVILIDGGSNAETLAQIKPYRAKFAYFVSEKDRGQSHAINKGLAVARGELVTWLNTDDFYLPGAVAGMAAAYRRNDAAPFYMGRGFRTNIDDSMRTPFYPERFAFSHEALIWGLNFILQPATFINHQALRAAGGLVSENLHFAMDTDLWLRLSVLGKPEWVEVDTACSREYPATKTSVGAWQRITEIQRVAQQHSGAELTPGVLAEVCRQLYEASEHPEAAAKFSPKLRSSIIALWGEAASGMRAMTSRDDGFPVQPEKAP